LAIFDISHPSLSLEVQGQLLILFKVVKKLGKISEKMTSNKKIPIPIRA